MPRAAVQPRPKSVRKKASRNSAVAKIRYGDTVVLAGARDPVGIEPQTRRVLDTIRDVLAQAGCTLADVVKTTVWLDDPRDFMNFNRVYREYFAENPPARSCVKSALMLDGKVEIEAIAYRPLAK